jgi:hypothetical protein
LVFVRPPEKSYNFSNTFLLKFFVVVTFLNINAFFTAFDDFSNGFGVDYDRHT